MVKFGMVLVDTDEQYLTSLTNYILEMESGKLEVQAFSDLELLDHMLTQGQIKANILVMASQLRSELTDQVNIETKILLNTGSEEVSGYSSVKKYQKTEQLINDILLAHSQNTGRLDSVRGNRRTKVAGVYSPVGGVGKTTIALATAVAAARTGQKVLYFNLEKIDTTYYLLAKSPGTISDVFLTASAKPGNAGLRFLSCRGVDPESQIHYISRGESVSEMLELQDSEIYTLLQEVVDLNEYDILFLDFNTEFNEEKVKLFQLCDTILMPFTPNGSAVERIKLFYQEDVLHDMYRDIFLKLKLILNKANVPAEQQQIQNLLGGRMIEVIIATSPVFSELRPLLKMRDTLYQTFRPVIELILKCDMR